jgi:hypothetical protein
LIEKPTCPSGRPEKAAKHELFQRMSLPEVRSGKRGGSRRNGRRRVIRGRSASARAAGFCGRAPVAIIFGTRAQRASAAAEAGRARYRPMGNTAMLKMLRAGLT